MVGGEKRVVAVGLGFFAGGCGISFDGVFWVFLIYSHMSTDFTDNFSLFWILKIYWFWCFRVAQLAKV